MRFEDETMCEAVVKFANFLFVFGTCPNHGTFAKNAIC